jgi:DNA polymerase-3 subunit delta'
MTFADLAGHERIVRGMRAVLAEDRPAHAYLVAGPTGIGKRTFTAAVTASLLCEARHGGDACGACAQCVRVAAGTHPDLLVVRREEDRRDIRTEQAREVTRWLTLRPLMARRKVAVIEEAECLNEHGQNALLKTLEEPPGATVLLLLATQASLLLPTVRSRCQRLRLDPLPAALVDRVLADRGIAPELRARVVGRAEGSPGRALALATTDDDGARARMLAELGRLPGAGAAELSAAAQALGRDDLAVALDVAVGWYRDVLALQVDGAAAMLRNADAGAPLRAAAERSSFPRVLRALDTVCDTIRDVERNANRVLALETMLLALRALERTPPANSP